MKLAEFSTEFLSLDKPEFKKSERVVCTGSRKEGRRFIIVCDGNTKDVGSGINVFSGTVLRCSETSGHYVGQYRNDWDQKSFENYYGDVTLSSRRE